MAWTLDCSFCLRNEGKSDGFDCVTVAFAPVSVVNRIVRRLLLLNTERERTLVFGIAALAFQHISICAFGRRQKIAAVGTKNEGADCCHYDFCFW